MVSLGVAWQGQARQGNSSPKFYEGGVWFGLVRSGGVRWGTAGNYNKKL